MPCARERVAGVVIRQRPWWANVPAFPVLLTARWYNERLIGGFGLPCLKKIGCTRKEEVDATLILAKTFHD